MRRYGLSVIVSLGLLIGGGLNSSLGSVLNPNDIDQNSVNFADTATTPLTLDVGETLQKRQRANLQKFLSGEYGRQRELERQREIQRSEALAAQRDAERRLAESNRRQAARSVIGSQGNPPSGDTVSTHDVWWRLAGCETGGKYDNPNTGNGYYGFLQFSLSTWQSVGGTGYPHHHSYDVQVEFGKRLYARVGWRAWPHCSRKLGLR